MTTSGDVLDLDTVTAREINEPLKVALARAEARGYRQFQIAQAARLDATLLSHWLHGRRRPSTDQATRLATVLTAALGEPVNATEFWPDLYRKLGQRSRAAR